MKYQIINFFSSKIIQHNVEMITYIPNKFFLWNLEFYFNWKANHIALKIHEDIKSHNFWKDFNEAIDSFKFK